MRRSTLFPIVLCVASLFCSSPSLPAETESEPVMFQTIAADDPVETGTDAVLVIDVSGSMKQSDPDYLCRSAALEFLEDLGDNSDSRAALITFSDTLQDVVPLAELDQMSDQNEIFSKLNSFSYTSGDTDIGLAMERAVNLLTEDGNDRARSIFLLTDGEIDLPAASDEEAAEKESLTRALVAVEKAKAAGIVIHCIALDLSGGIDINLMNYMADSTGGTSSVVNCASALKDAFRKLSDYAARQSVPETEAEVIPEETETETETEKESETETEEPVRCFVQTIGSVDGPVHLKGLLPGLCSARLTLSDLFRLEGGMSGFTDSIRYTAYPDDNSMLTCSIENDSLLLSGLENGSCTVHVIAEPAGDGTSGIHGEDMFSDYGGILYDGRNEEGTPVWSGSEQAQLSFSVTVDALIPSIWYLALIPAFAALAGILIFFFLHRPDSHANLSGTLQWYVRGENEKIFGMPPRTMADLSDYGNKVRLSELVQDDLLSGAPLHKVTINGTQQGILISSKSPDIAIAATGVEAQRRVELFRSGQFKVLCETGNGHAAVIAFYTADGAYKAEPSYEDDSAERTRLLV